MPRSKHRAGRPWRRAKAVMRAVYGDTCHLCGHAEAYQADHVDALAWNPDRPVRWQDLRPAHGGGRHDLPAHRGGDNPCPECGARCNQVKGAGPAPLRTSREW